MAIRAAQYLRMSAEHQQYSLANQAAKIAEYADQHSFEIVKTYVDSGRSGVTSNNRPGLAGLLADVVSRQLTFNVVLVYDVSRWGRFQDTDESAHYEFLCKKAGVPIHYCAEQFPNDGSVPASLLKALKRAMAAEYSRELGVKVYKGQERLAKKGFWMGAMPGYGLRRMMLSAEGTPKGLLHTGEHKSFTKDRVILVPGPPHEVEVVKKIFTWALSGMPAIRIANRLNEMAVDSPAHAPWTHETVLYLLRNPKYMGVNVWGRTSQRLGVRSKRLSPESWIRSERAFVPIVSEELFKHVQEKISVHQVYSDEEMLDGLRKVLREFGKITRPLIDRTKGIPCESAYYDRFGNLGNAYARIGYMATIFDQSYFEQRERTTFLREQIIGRVVAWSAGRAKVIKESKTARPQLLVDRQIKVDVLVCPHSTNRTGLRSWFYYPHSRKFPVALTLACALNRANRKISRIFLVPGFTKRQRLTEERFEQIGIHVSKPAQCPDLCYHEKWINYLYGIA